MLSPEMLAILIRVVGSLTGAFLALVFQPPKVTSELVTRGLFSLICGFVFSPPLRDYLKWAPSTEIDLAAAALTAMLSWWLMSTVVRIVGAWKPPK